MTSRQFEQFVATERGMLVRLAMNILHHPEDADDAVAEALCKAWERREQLRSPDKMRSWVAKITVNTALSMIQKRKRENWWNLWTTIRRQRSLVIRIAEFGMR